MVFVYEPFAKNETLILCDETYNYLFKVRRHKVGDRIVCANLEDETLYSYEVHTVDKKSARLVLVHTEYKPVSRQMLHLAWCMIDPKVIEKTLPMLNELGVTMLTLLYCQRSQANFRLSDEKIKKILIASSQQCGRLDPMKIEIKGTLEEFLSSYPQTVVIDFGGELWSDVKKDVPYLIGCEGGFTALEKEQMSSLKKISFKGNQVLRSETVVVAVASKIAL